MGYKHLNYTKEQIELLKIYYPIEDWDKLFEIFPEYKKKQIQKIAYQYNIKSNNPTKIKNIIGKTFGELTVVSFSRLDKMGAYWNCICSCGKECEKLGSYLRYGNVKSCGHLCKTDRYKNINKNKNGGYKDKTGNRYGFLVVKEMLLNYYGKGKHGCLCNCDCGNTIIIPTRKLLPSKFLKSCGKCPKYIIKERNKIKKDENKNVSTYIIYKHTSPSGKYYIGMTKNTWMQRANKGNGYISCTKFYNAIKKYGWDNFKHEILEEGLTQEEAIKKEQYYINLYNSKINGYNLSTGGFGPRQYGREIIQLSPLKEIVNIFMSESEIASIIGTSHKIIAKWASRDELINGYYWCYVDKYEGIIDYNKYKDIDYNYLKFDPYEYGREQMKKYGTINGKKGLESKIKKINQYTLDGIYIKTYNSIAETYNMYGTSVFSAVHNSRGTAYGYQWRYYEGNTNNIDPVDKGNGKKIIKLDGKTQKIITIYETMTKAWKTEKISFHSLKEACENHNKHNNGYYYNYYIDYFKKGDNNVIY